MQANLEQLLPRAETLDVALLLKTSGIYAVTEQLRRMLERFAGDQLAALRDVPVCPVHTGRIGLGEPYQKEQCSF